jgi:putative peptidoglycan lipid II flippase
VRDPVTQRAAPKPQGVVFGLSVLSLANFLTAVLSYLRFAGIARIFGADWRTDAFAVALALPFLVRDLIVHSFGSTFLPIYARVVETKGKEGAIRFTNLVLTWVAISGSLLMIPLFAASRQAVTAVSPGGSPDMLAMASLMLRILVPTVLLRALSGILSIFIQYEKRFSTMGIAGIMDLGISTGMLFIVGSRWGVMVLPWSVTAGVGLAFGYVFVCAVRSGFKPKPVIERDPHLGQLAKMAGPVMLGTLAGFLGPVADKILASFLIASSITALDYADRIRNLVFTVAFSPFALMAELNYSTRAARGENAQLITNLKTGLNQTSLIMFPMAALLTVIAFPLVSVLFQRGSFTADNAKYVAYALAFYAPLLVRSGLFSLTSKAFYALKDSTTPVVIGVIGLAINVLLNFILIAPLGIGGLALATTVSSTLKAIYQTWALSRKMGGLGLRDIIPEQLRMALAVVGMIGAVLLLRVFLPFNPAESFIVRIFLLCIYGLSGSAVYVATLAALRCRTLGNTVERLMRAKRSRQSVS